MRKAAEDAALLEIARLKELQVNQCRAPAPCPCLSKALPMPFNISEPFPKFLQTPFESSLKVFQSFQNPVKGPTPQTPNPERAGTTDLRTRTATPSRRACKARVRGRGAERGAGCGQGANLRAGRELVGTYVLYIPFPVLKRDTTGESWYKTGTLFDQKGSRSEGRQLSPPNRS